MSAAAMAKAFLESIWRVHSGDRRECGDCSECCGRLQIKAMRSPVRVDCEHRCDAGCGIYDERPSECRDWVCGWILGVGVKDDRPDKSGIIASPTSTPGKQIPFLIALTESRPDAFTDSPDTLKRMRHYYRATFVPSALRSYSHDGPLDVECRRK